MLIDLFIENLDDQEIFQQLRLITLYATWYDNKWKWKK